MLFSKTKELLIERLLEGNRVAEPPGQTVIPKRPFAPNSRVPMSLSQEQIWKRSLRASEDRSFYNENITIHGNGPVDLPALERAFTEIVRRHEVWRTSLSFEDGAPVQVVHPAPDGIEIPLVDLSAVPIEDREEQASSVISRWVVEPLGLKGEPMVKARLVKLDDMRYRFVVIAHQGVVDGVSAYQLFPAELAALYSAIQAAVPASLPDLPIQFGDFSIWHRDWLSGDRYAEQCDYWKRRLAAPVGELRWPRIEQGRMRNTCGGAILPFEVRPDVSEAAGQLGRREGATLFAVLLTGFATWLHRYTRQDDIVIGTLSPTGRKRAECQNLLGYFLNPVALRFDFGAKPGFRELLSQARRVLAEAISYDDIPYETLEQTLGLAGTGGRFLRAAISLQPKSPKFENGWRVTTMDARQSASSWDYYLAFIQREDELEGRVQYNPAIFEEREIIATLEGFFSELSGARDEAPAFNVDVRARPDRFAFDDEIRRHGTAQD